MKPSPSCFICAVHLIRCARAFALDRAGSNKLARIAMIAMTTSSSIKVKALKDVEGRSRGFAFMLGLSPRWLFHDDLEVLRVNAECLSRGRLRQVLDVSSGNQLVQGSRHLTLLDAESAKCLRQFCQNIREVRLGTRDCRSGRWWRGTFTAAKAQP